MRARTKARLIALPMLSILLSLALYWAIYSYSASRSVMGKEAFLSSQAQRFDRFYAQPQRLFVVVHWVYIGLCITAVLGLYELLSLGIYKVVGPDKSKGDGTPIT